MWLKYNTTDYQNKHKNLYGLLECELFMCTLINFITQLKTASKVQVVKKKISNRS